jgi:glycosyltransferase involved in cell wall biosynthesis
MKNIAVLIPCFNEEQTVAKVITDMRRELPEATIYVYDNNSTDNTVKEAQAAGAVVREEHRQGKGYVMRSMFRDIEADVYIMVDGDDTYPAEKVKELIEPVLQGKADMVNGSRLHSTSKSTFKPLNFLGNKMFLTIINTIFKHKVTDLLTGFRAFNRQVISLPLFSKGFDIETELTLKALEHNLNIMEIPIDLTDRPKGSKSKINIFRDGTLILQAIFTIMRDYKPLTSFGLMGLACFALGFLIGKDNVSFLFQSSNWDNIAPFVAMLVAFLGVCVILIGILLHTISRRFQELETQMRGYFTKRDSGE